MQDKLHYRVLNSLVMAYDAYADLAKYFRETGGGYELRSVEESMQELASFIHDTRVGMCKPKQDWESV